jgi:hypothetical protein
LDTLERVLDLRYRGTMSSAEYGQLVEFLGRKFADVDRRFDAMDRRFTQMVAELRHEMLGHFDAIYQRFERLEQEYQAILRPCGGSRPDSPTTRAGARFSSATSPN